MSNNRFSRWAWGVLAYNLAVILWGAAVRATGSGAGCGSHWPLCNGEVIPRSPSTETLIELAHRTSSGLALVAVVVSLVWSVRRFAAGHPARRAAVWSTVFIVTEAAVGAGLVLFELVADNESMARALFMGAHLCNTFLLIASLALTAYWGHGGRQALGARRLGGFAWAAIAATALIGVSGAVAALGDTLYPAESLERALRADLSATSHVLIRLRLGHPLIAVAASMLILFFAVRVRRDERGTDARRFSAALAALVFVQLSAGILNVVLLAPVWMQLVHLLLADLLWIALVLTLAGRCAAPSAG